MIILIFGWISFSSNIKEEWLEIERTRTDEKGRGQTSRPLRDTGMLLLEANSPYLYLLRRAKMRKNTQKRVEQKSYYHSGQPWEIITITIMHKRPNMDYVRHGH